MKNPAGKSHFPIVLERRATEEISSYVGDKICMRECDKLFPQTSSKPTGSSIGYCILKQRKEPGFLTSCPGFCQGLVPNVS